MAKKLYYKIGEACKRLDIQPYVLRYWETEFPMLRPDKSSSGQRVYSEKDLATIRRIKELLYDEGYTIAGAKKKLDGEDLNALVAKQTKRDAEAAAKPEAAPDAEEATGTAAADEPPPPKPAPKKTRAKKKKKAPAAAQASAAAAQASGAAAQASGAAAQAPGAAAQASSAAAKELAALRQGVENALAQARGILDLLDSSSPKR